MAFSTTINGRAVAADFDLDDLRPSDMQPEKNLGGIQVTAELTIDGERHNVLLQCEDDGILEVASSDAGNDDAHRAAALALGWEEDEDGDANAWGFLDGALEEVTAAAQAIFDEYIAGEVVNDSAVSEEEMVTGFELACGCLLAGWGFACDGDGYLTIHNAERGSREAVRYRLDGGLVERLDAIKDETRFDDALRTSRVLDVFDPERNSAD